MNDPYHSPEKFNLEILAFEDPDADYSFDTLCFWKTPEGLVYSASDSGCSCPSPFEDYEGETQEAVLQKLERIGSVSQAEQIFDSWGKGSLEEKESLRKFCGALP